MLERLRRMNTQLILILWTSFLLHSSSYAMYCRRQAPRIASPRVQTFPRPPRVSPHSRRYYSESKIVNALNKQIIQCKISEREIQDEFSLWESIAVECAWRGKCVTGGSCDKDFNCLSNTQFAYLAWKDAFKELALYEYALGVATFGKIPSRNSKFKK